MKNTDSRWAARRCTSWTRQWHRHRAVPEHPAGTSLRRGTVPHCVLARSVPRSRQTPGHSWRVLLIGRPASRDENQAHWLAGVYHMSTGSLSDRLDSRKYITLTQMPSTKCKAVAYTASSICSRSRTRIAIWGKKPPMKPMIHASHAFITPHGARNHTMTSYDC